MAYERWCQGVGQADPGEGQVGGHGERAGDVAEADREVIVLVGPGDDQPRRHFDHDGISDDVAYAQVVRSTAGRRNVLADVHGRSVHGGRVGIGVGTHSRDSFSKGVI